MDCGSDPNTIMKRVCLASIPFWVLTIVCIADTHQNLSYEYEEFNGKCWKTVYVRDEILAIVPLDCFVMKKRREIANKR